MSLERIETILYGNMSFNLWSILVRLPTPLLRTSGNVYPGFQSQNGSFDCVLCHLCAMDSSDSPLVRHLLDSRWPAWQPRFSDPHTSKHIHKQLWTLNSPSKPQHHTLIQSVTAIQHVYCKIVLDFSIDTVQ